MPSQTLIRYRQPMDYNNIHGSILAITLGFFLFGLLLSGKLKWLRHIFWGGGIIGLICYILMFLNHKNGLDTKEKQIVESYRLDTHNSVYRSRKVNKYYDVVFILKSDHTFKVNREVPFFYSLTGSWTYFNNGEMSGITGKFDRWGNEFEVYDAPKSLSFNNWNLINASNGDEIVFVRL